jgi:hypothetical protein
MFQIPGFVFLMSIKQEIVTVHNTCFWQEFDLFCNSFFNTKTLSISDISLPACGKAVDLCGQSVNIYL